ncbi:hypothetical protein [Rhodoferax aquaticus]|uniref:Uncharacterized protein n=1 Tax=Rhodoferax aquaticus TaxID=2527691 RepID=A0A515ERN3_9BURK|nr:hypothetical protein [Rhodoferax aquaticus]QDL55315.1 hypothetical protein EXZ61_14690 [Rhodoferax aquaticus]
MMNRNPTNLQSLSQARYPFAPGVIEAPPEPPLPSGWAFEAALIGAIVIVVVVAVAVAIGFMTGYFNLLGFAR